MSGGDGELAQDLRREGLVAGDLDVNLGRLGATGAEHEPGRVVHAEAKGGLGGRLDSTNAVDGDVAVVTNIFPEHLDWHGSEAQYVEDPAAGVQMAGRAAAAVRDDAGAAAPDERPAAGSAAARRSARRPLGFPA